MEHQEKKEKACQTIIEASIQLKFYSYIKSYDISRFLKPIALYLYKDDQTSYYSFLRVGFPRLIIHHTKYELKEVESAKSIDKRILLRG